MRRPSPCPSERSRTSTTLLFSTGACAGERGADRALRRVAVPLCVPRCRCRLRVPLPQPGESTESEPRRACRGRTREVRGGLFANHAFGLLNLKTDLRSDVI